MLVWPILFEASVLMLYALSLWFFSSFIFVMPFQLINFFCTKRIYLSSGMKRHCLSFIYFLGFFLPFFQWSVMVFFLNKNFYFIVKCIFARAWIKVLRIFWCEKEHFVFWLKSTFIKAPIRKWICVWNPFYGYSFFLCMCVYVVAPVDMHRIGAYKHHHILSFIDEVSGQWTKFLCDRGRLTKGQHHQLEMFTKMCQWKSTIYTDACISDKWNFNWARSNAHNYIIVNPFVVIRLTKWKLDSHTHPKCKRNGQLLINFAFNRYHLKRICCYFSLPFDSISLVFFFEWIFAVFETLMNVDTNQFLNAYFVCGGSAITIN